MVLDDLEAILLQETALSVNYIDKPMFELKKELYKNYQDGYDDALCEVRRHVVILGLTD
jgi:hypothetical protein